MNGRADATERVCILFIINVVKDREVADQVLHFWREDLAAGRARQNVASAEVKQAVLAERVPAQ